MEKRLSIQQMVIATGLSAHTLRYYERIGLIQPGRDHSSGYRSYNEQDVNLIEFIKRLRATGMPVRDVVRYTDLMRQGETTIAARLDLLKQHRRRVEDAQREVDQHLAAITAKIAYYQARHAQSVQTTVPFLTCSEEERAEQGVAQEERDSATDYSWT